MELAAGRPAGAIRICQLRLEQDRSPGSLLGGETPGNHVSRDSGTIEYKQGIHATEGEILSHFQVSGVGHYTDIYSVGLHGKYSRKIQFKRQDDYLENTDFEVGVVGHLCRNS